MRIRYKHIPLSNKNILTLSLELNPDMYGYITSEEVNGKRISIINYDKYYENYFSDEYGNKMKSSVFTFRYGWSVWHNNKRKPFEIIDGKKIINQYSKKEGNALAFERMVIRNFDVPIGNIVRLYSDGIVFRALLDLCEQINNNLNIYYGLHNSVVELYDDVDMLSDETKDSIRSVSFKYYCYYSRRLSILGEETW